MKLKIMTLNIWLGGEFLDRIIPFIKRENPDILALQEVYDSKDTSHEDHYRTLEVLREALDYPYDDFAAEFLESLPFGKVEQGNAVFSRLPITAHKTVFFDRPYDENYLDIPNNYASISHNLQRLELQTEKGPLTFINFHGVWDLDGDNDSKARQNMVRVLMQNFDAQENVIITGDTNARPTNASMQKLGTILTNVFGSTLKSTFNMKHKDNPGYASSVVDMVFASPRITVTHKYVPDDDVSDHLPLVVEVQLPN